jgi:orotate phosphoribosyltransferase
MAHSMTNMKSVDSLAKKAAEYKEKGLSEKEIGDELHLSPETVTWLLTRGLKGGEAPPKDVKIGWRSVGVYGNRIGFVAAAMTDIILEEAENSGNEPDTIAGIAINGIPYATLISEDMGMELAIYRPSETRHQGGAWSSNYASVEGKKVVLIDDVLSSGDTILGAINDISEADGKAVLAVVVVNKTEKNELHGVPLRGLIRARAIT